MPNHCQRNLRMSEDINDYQITPEDLGCMGEEENPPGLVEETIGETKTPVPKSFKHIPFEVKKRARKLYDGFDQKDMPFEEFCVELYALESPKLMQADLHNMVMEKQDRSRLAFANMHKMKQSMN